MLTILRLLLAYAVPTVIGYCLIVLLERGKVQLAAGERWALGFALGSGVLTYFMFYLGFLGLPLTFWTSSAAFWPCLLLAGLTRRRRAGKVEGLPLQPGALSDQGKSGRYLAIFLGVLLAGKLASISYTIAVSPTYFDDSVSFWNLKGKVYYHHKSIILDESHPDFLGAKNPHYPNGIPLFKTWIGLSLNRWSDRLVNSNTFFYYLCLGLVFYYCLRPFLSTAVAFPLTYGLLSLPLLVFSAGFAYFDIVIGLYFLGATAYLYRWIREERTIYLILSASFGAVGLGVKEEMMVLGAAGAIPLLFLGQMAKGWKIIRIMKNSLLWLSIVLLPNIPWFWLKWSRSIMLGLAPQDRAPEFHPETFRAFGHYLFDAGNFNIFWMVFLPILLSGFFFIQRKEFSILYPSVLLTLAVTAAPFVFSSFSKYVGNTASRAFMTGMPMLFFFAGIYLEQLLRREA